MFLTFDYNQFNSHRTSNEVWWVLSHPSLVFFGFPLREDFSLFGSLRHRLDVFDF
jgi:hypothetical protein